MRNDERNFCSHPDSGVKKNCSLFRLWTALLLEFYIPEFFSRSEINSACGWCKSPDCLKANLFLTGGSVVDLNPYEIQENLDRPSLWSPVFSLDHALRDDVLARAVPIDERAVPFSLPVSSVPVSTEAIRELPKLASDGLMVFVFSVRRLVDVVVSGHLKSSLCILSED